MSTIPPTIQNLARQLIAGEPPRSTSGTLDQAVHACEKLRVPLTKLTGAVGFASLLSRALAIAKRNEPSLEVLRVEADGSLSGLNEIPEFVEAPQAARQGGIVLMTELLGLLVTFIGEPLTLRLVHQAWPNISIETISLSSKENP
ncbi:MAG: hypothetical protein M3O30_11040 [Planctomycetota bacterium]|nr:hypothetical protein [Planctomycetota bacterium]